MDNKNIKICRVVQVPLAFKSLLKEQINTTIKEGYDVHLVCSDGDDSMRSWPGAHFHPIQITRNVSPWKDFLAVISLYRYFRKNRIQVMHSVTQKAGLLCSISSWLARVPIRIHTFVGQSWLELSGVLRWILIAGDWLTVKLNTHCFADSQSQIDLLISAGICKKGDVKVIGAGSIAGVNLAKFDPDLWRDKREGIKKELNIPSNAKVITFIGRLTVEKGIRELIEAFDLLISKRNDLILILVGPFQIERFPLAAETVEHIKTHPFIRLVGYSSEPEKYLSITDLFCLPTYREGFGGVIIEAGSMCVATVSSKVVGVIDAVVDGETGRLVPAKNALALANVINELLNDDDKRLKMGANARKRALENFDSVKVNDGLLNEYKRIFAEKEIGLL